MAYLIGTIFLIVSILLVLVVLLQKGRGGGLGGAFGGAGAGSAFGTRTGDVFTWVTIVLTALFLLLAVVSALAFRPDVGQVAAPQFDPAEWPDGLEAEHVTVKMGSPTANATIRFTLDGTDPTEKSLAYQRTAIKVRTGQTLTARAYRAGFDPSEIVRVTYQPRAAAPAETQPTLPLAPTTTPAEQPATEPAS